MKRVTVIFDQRYRCMMSNIFNNDIDIWLYCIFWGKLWSIFGLVRVFEKFYVWAFFILQKWFLNYSKLSTMLKKFQYWYDITDSSALLWSKYILDVYIQWFSLFNRIGALNAYCMHTRSSMHQKICAYLKRRGIIICFVCSDSILIYSVSVLFLRDH